MIEIMKPFPFHRLRYFHEQKYVSIFQKLIFCHFYSLDNLSVDERLYKDMQDLVFQKIRESLLIQKNITPMNTVKPEEVKACQANFAHYVIQASR